jgi:hypothetical protein
MNESGQPLYVDRSNDIVFRPPYLQTNAKLTAWVLPSNLTALQAVCDNALNNPMGGASATTQYRPILGAVFLVLAQMQKVSSLDPRDSQRGWVPEEDVCFWILTAAYVNGQFDHLAYYIPYIWVTSPYTLATGREVYGYLKSFGYAKLAESPSDPGPLWGDGLVLATYTPETEVTRERIISLTQGPTLLGTPQTFGAGQQTAAVNALLDRIIPTYGAPGVDWTRVRTLAANMSLPIVFLKQFRDCVDPTAACYQAVVEANASVVQMNAAQCLPTAWSLTLQQYASATILDDLALSAGPTTVNLGFWLDYTFSQDLGRVIWSAGT